MSNTAFASHFAASSEAARQLLDLEQSLLKCLVSRIEEAVQALGGRVELLEPGEVTLSDCIGLRVVKVHAVTVEPGAGGIRLECGAGGARETINPEGAFVRVYTLPEFAQFLDQVAFVPPVKVV